MALIKNTTPVETGLALLPLETPTAPTPPPIPFVKAVEGTGYFQKERRTQTMPALTGADLRFTYCDVTDYGTRAFGNLFSSFRLPVSAADRSALGAIFLRTALQGLEDVEKVVVAEIPANAYGEMVDGKTLELRVPLLLNGTQVVYTLYGGYYGFNTDLNNQYSDTNALSGYLGAEPTPENDFNSNIAYLFCNEIQRPKDTVTLTPLLSSTLTVPARGSAFFNQALLAGTTYQLTALQVPTLRVKVLIAGLGLLDLAEVAENGIVSADGTFRLRQPVTQIYYYNDTYADLAVDNRVLRLDVGSSRNWSTWTPTNRYPATSNGVGKSVATLVDATGRGIYDEPVGLVYLDKGLVVLTHPTLVENLRRDVGSGATVQDPADATQLVAAPATGPYTRLHYAGDDGTLASLAYRSVVTELSQIFTCMAGIGEFTQSANPTYALAYPDGGAGQPVYITEVGLYNWNNELIALAKCSAPLLKQANRPVLFTINLRV